MNRKKTIIGITAISFALILGFWGTSPLQNEYTSVEEITANSENLIGQKIKADGIIKENSIKVNQKKYSFTLKSKEGNAQIKVIDYQGNVNIKSQEGQRIVAIGELTQKNTLKCTKILTPCKENYQF
ncbi:MAG: Cytochrome c-type biogenesis protein CcmE [Candidatus Methanohalarchaeum thermophilum]|uniref:Cytochrome c-type biogenesis protein CcmE n=1 Tax=Methanohalarchaeum thermophilum TaxID=1903181 RepID=A0A1Q6DS41_METT1|nr:MAG: Cytochrome c-type biogenesis protein CcmE [Candidatus Methanohalarchaeum thermophilum]